MAIVAGAATGVAQLSDNFTSPAAPVPGHGLTTSLTMTGSRTGKFTGGVTGNQGTIAVLGLDVGLTVPIDQNSGLPSGRAACRGINFRKPTDRATPLLFASAASGETITDATFNEHRNATTQRGTLQVTLQIKLRNAIISSFHHVNATTTGSYDDVTLIPAAVTFTWPAGVSRQFTCHRSAR